MSVQIVLQNVDKSHGTSKMVNELMQGLFTDEYMATHSIAGMGNNKDAMDPTVLAKIVGWYCHIPYSLFTTEH